MTRKGSVAALVAAFALGACSFFSDFPDVERLGEGGASAASTGTESAATESTSATPDATTSSSSSASSAGDGGAGGSSGSSSGGGGSTSTGFECEPGLTGAGGLECVDCRDCWSGLCACPELADGSMSLRINGQEPTDPATTSNSLAVVDIVSLPGGAARYVGHGKSLDGSPRVELPGGQDDILGTEAYGIGFILDEEGQLVTSAMGCTDGEPGFADEVFFMGATRALDPRDDSEFVVVAGAFEAGALAFDTSASPSCATSDLIAGPNSVATSAATPFLAWLEDGQLTRSISADTEEAIAYLADVADFPASPDASVVAVGVGSGDVLDAAGEDLADEIFLVTSNGTPDKTNILRIGRSPCDAEDHTEAYSGFDNSVAVDVDGQVWVAGTGCQVGIGPQADLSSYLAVVETQDETAVDVIDMMVFGALGDDDSDVAIKKVAVTDDLVIVAGRFTGTPAYGTQSFPATGQIDLETDADGFVMAFERANWSNTSPLSWFTWIGASANVIVSDLSVGDDGSVYVAGSYGSFIQMAPVQTCLAGDDLLSRAFFAELDPTTGDARWTWTEGVRSTDFDPFIRAHGTAIEPSQGDVLIAEQSHGRLLMTCGTETGVEAEPKPLVILRTLLRQ